MERELDRRIGAGAASAVMWSVYRTIVVKKELSRKGGVPGMSHREEASGRDTLERLCLSRLAWKCLGIPLEELEEVSREGEGKSGHLCLDCCLRDQVPDKQRKMGGWMDIKQ
ncbi:hypothetical protein L3Q82_023065, partial [Scortum barcoo]